MLLTSSRADALLFCATKAASASLPAAATFCCSLSISCSSRWSARASARDCSLPKVSASFRNCADVCCASGSAHASACSSLSSLSRSFFFGFGGGTACAREATSPASAPKPRLFFFGTAFLAGDADGTTTGSGGVAVAGGGADGTTGTAGSGGVAAAGDFERNFTGMLLVGSAPTDLPACGRWSRALGRSPSPLSRPNCKLFSAFSFFLYLDLCITHCNSLRDQIKTTRTHLARRRPPSDTNKKQTARTFRRAEGR
jgi:hypothetical protein